MHSLFCPVLLSPLALLPRAAAWCWTLRGYVPPSAIRLPMSCVSFSLSPCWQHTLPPLLLVRLFPDVFDEFYPISKHPVATKKDAKNVHS